LNVSALQLRENSMFNVRLIEVRRFARRVTYIQEVANRKRSRP